MMPYCQIEAIEDAGGIRVSLTPHAGDQTPVEDYIYSLADGWKSAAVVQRVEAIYGRPSCGMVRLVDQFSHH